MIKILNRVLLLSYVLLLVNCTNSERKIAKEISPDEAIVKDSVVKTKEVLISNDDLKYDQKYGISPLVFKTSQGKPDLGGLIVTKGDLCDTIYDCHYGLSPEHEILKNDSEEFLFTHCEMNGGGDNWKSFFVWSLRDETFMQNIFDSIVQVDKILRDTNDEYRIVINRKPELKIKGQLIYFKVDSTVQRMNWKTSETTEIISTGSKLTTYPF